jgi:hypothetical protein
MSVAKYASLPYIVRLLSRIALDYAEIVTGYRSRCLRNRRCISNERDNGELDAQVGCNPPPLIAGPYAFSQKGESEEEGQGGTSRRGKDADLPVNKEDLDSSSLMTAAEAGKKFKRAEKRSGECLTLSLNIHC